MIPRTDRGYYVLPDGARYVRVSTVLRELASPGLAKWQATVGLEEADRIRRESADYGTAMHAVLEEINRARMAGRKPDKPADERFLPVARAYWKWLEQNVAEVIDCERFVKSDPNRYAGTCDALLALKSGELAVVDFKSNKWREPSESHCVQLSAYQCALREEGVQTARRLVLQFPSDAPGELLVHDYAEHERDEHWWRALLAVYWYRQDWLQQSAELKGSTLRLERAVSEHLRTAIPDHPTQILTYLVDWNDDPARTHAEVLALLDRALAATEGEG